MSYYRTIEGNQTALAALRKARGVSRRMRAAARAKRTLNWRTVARWADRLDHYRARGDWFSALDFMHEYGPGIDQYCRPSRWSAAA